MSTPIKRLSDCGRSLPAGCFIGLAVDILIVAAGLGLFVLTRYI